MLESKKQTTIEDPSEILDGSHDDLFLLSSIVKIIVKLAKNFELSSVDEFSIMETLHFAMLKNTEAFSDNLDEKAIALFLVNIISISDKFNNAGSKMTQARLEPFLTEFGVTIDQLNSCEFSVFKSIDFEVQQSKAVDLIFDLVSTHLDEQNSKPVLFEIALDVLRVVFLKAEEIYEEFTRNFDPIEAIKLKQNKPLLASAVFIVLIKLINASDRFHNQMFDLTVSRLDSPKAAAMLNQLAAIIFKNI